MRSGILLFCLVAVSAQASLTAASAQVSRKGPGIEVGASHNQLRWKAWGPAGPWVARDRTDLYVAPTLRLTYLAPLFCHVDLLSFAGYHESGGRSTEAAIRVEPGRSGSGTDAYRFRNVEAGVLALYRLGRLRLGAGTKVDRLVEATRLVEVAFDGPEGGSDTFRLDRTDAFRDWSTSAGVRTEWSVLRLAIFAEAWFGLVNLDAERRDDVHQHQVRLGVGYRL